MSLQDERRPLLVEYSAATALVTLALGIQWLLDGPLYVQTAFQCSMLAIAVIAYLFRSNVALYAVLISAIGQDLFFIEPRGKLWISDLGVALQFSLFILVSLTLCYVIDRLKRARTANESTLRELIRSNRARQLSEHRLDAGLNSMEDPILLLHPVRDVQGRIEDFLIEYLNAPAADLNPANGVSRESQLGKRLSQAAPIHAQYGLIDDYVKVVESNTRMDRELMIQSEKAGPPREVQIRAYRLGDGVVVHWRDVSDYRLAQFTSRISEGRYQSLVQAIGAIVWNVPASGEFETQQLEWSVFTGQKFDELRGWGWLNAVHPDDRSRTAQQWSAAMANGRSLDIEHRLRRSDGQYRHMQVRAVPIHDPDGKVREWLGVHTDITDRKQAEEIISDNERQLRRVLNALYTFVLVLSPDGKLMGANESPLREAGIRSEDVVGKPLWDAYWWGYDSTAPAEIRKRVERARQGEIVREDVQMRMANRKTLTADFMLYPMRDESGEITHLIASGVDVSDRERARADLADRERHYRQLIEGLPMLTWTCTREGDCDFLNQGWVNYTGRKMDSLLGAGWLDAVHADDRARLVSSWTHSVRTGEPMMVEFRIARSDGMYRWHDTRAVPIRDAEGRIARWFGTNIDVEDRRRAEQRFRRLVESNLIGIVFFDEAGKLTDMNEAFLSIIGADGAALPGAFDLQSLTPPEWKEVDRHENQMLFETGRCGPYAKEFYRSDRTRVSVMIAAAEIDPGKHDAGVAIVIDMTPVKRVEATLRKTEASLRQVNESLEQRIRERTAELQLRSDQLRALALDITETESRERKRLAQVLHDHFQQLVSAAKLKVGIIRRRITDEALLQTVQQAEALLAETIDASRSLVTELSPPVLHDAGLRVALEWLARKMEKDHDLHVETQIDPGCEPDNEQVRTIIFECARELLFNVVKHAGTSKAELTVSMPQEGLLQVSVRDEGKGFDPYVLDTAAKPDGTFGLLSIKERLGLLGGLVRIRSAPGQGTTMVITVPVTAVAPAHHASNELTSMSPAPDAKAEVPRVRVLVADDHRLFREGLISLISQETFVDVIGQANDGQEAVDLATQLQPDILLCDVTMPRLNGIQVTTQLSRDLPNLKIIGLSMHEQDDMANAMREAGAVAYCTKGGPTDHLLSVLRAVASSGEKRSASDPRD